MIHAKLVLISDEKLEPGEVTALRYILSDALQDFRHARKNGNAELYVTERYDPKLGPYGEPGSERFKQKVAEVETRLRLAQRLHNAAVGCQVMVVEDLHDWLDNNAVFH